MNTQRICLCLYRDSSVDCHPLSLCHAHAMDQGRQYGCRYYGSPAQSSTKTKFHLVSQLETIQNSFRNHPCTIIRIHIMRHTSLTNDIGDDSFHRRRTDSPDRDACYVDKSWFHPSYDLRLVHRCNIIAFNSSSFHSDCPLWTWIRNIRVHTRFSGKERLVTHDTVALLFISSSIVVVVIFAVFLHVAPLALAQPPPFVYHFHRVIAPSQHERNVLHSPPCRSSAI